MSQRVFLDGKVTLYGGDSRDVLATLPDCSIDSVVTDPPYALVSIVKRFGKEGSAPVKGDVYARASSGFMGKQWDTGDTAFATEFWAQVLRVLKPGGHVVAFSGTRTYHRMTCAIEDAGFEIRDQIMWVYGSGFPKSHDVSKAIDKAAGAERDVVGARTDGRYAYEFSAKASRSGGIMGGEATETSRGQITAPATDAACEWQGWGTALKPSVEPICLARKPLIGTVAANVQQHGTGALNIDGCRVQFASASDLQAAAAAAMRASADQNAGRTAYGQFNNGAASVAPYLANIDKGRWPANLIHDGSHEVLAGFPETTSGSIALHHKRSTTKTGDVYGERNAVPEVTNGDSGSAARFFYQAKADCDDRLGSKHPTVKPIDLMQYLVRLVTPKGGVVLDPFAGTGTTGEAAWREGMRAILIEREAEYQADIARRMDLATKPTKRAAVAKTKNQLDDPNALPLFALPGK